jgi:hypothetical protein
MAYTSLAFESYSPLLHARFAVSTINYIRNKEHVNHTHTLTTHLSTCHQTCSPSRARFEISSMATSRTSSSSNGSGPSTKSTTVPSARPSMKSSTCASKTSLSPAYYPRRVQVSPHTGTREVTAFHLPRRGQGTQSTYNSLDLQSAPLGEQTRPRSNHYLVPSDARDNIDFLAQRILSGLPWRYRELLHTFCKGFFQSHRVVLLCCWDNRILLLQKLSPFLVPPHTYTACHYASYYRIFMCPPRRPVRNPHQCICALVSIRGAYHTIAVIRQILSWPLEQLQMDGRWKRPWWAA